jgi:hypothetical protein
MNSADLCAAEGIDHRLGHIGRDQVADRDRPGPPDSSGRAAGTEA